MTQFHIVPEINEANGVWRVASLLAQEQGGAVLPASAPGLQSAIAGADEVWVHGAWLPRLWRAARLALRVGKRLVRMTHGSLSPIYLSRQSPFRKRLVSPVERFFLRRADRVVATCAAEADWIRAFEPRVKKIVITDIRRFFDLSHKEHKERKEGEPLHLLYLGRRHLLKGLQYLEEAVSKINSVPSVSSVVELKIISSAFGAEKEAAFDWCDVLVLPTLSENFGLVVAEALEHGKRVITTDGAPAWEPEECESVKMWKYENLEIWKCRNGAMLYLKGFRNGTDAERVSLLKDAIQSLLPGF